MAEPLVPSEFTVPRTLMIGDLRLEPLGPEHNERDHAAWMSSIDYIHTIPGFRSDEREWPVEMSLEQNLADLEMHARHFQERSGFTYSVLDGTDVFGCVYIDPTDRPGCDVEVRSWVTERRADLDTVLWQAVSAWLEGSWPFAQPFYEPRP